MIDALPAVLPRVDHSPITGLGNLLLPRDGSRQRHHPSQQIEIRNVVQRFDVPRRDDEDVNRSLGFKSLNATTSLLCATIGVGISPCAIRQKMHASAIGLPRKCERCGGDRDSGDTRGLKT